jgi:perosamine synthetase
MTWVREPPVYSPVALRTLAAGVSSMFGNRESAREALVARLRHRYDFDDVVLTESGTAALVIALRALVPRGGSIAYPAYGCIDLTAAAVRAGVHVRLYDLDPTTLSPDLDSVSAVIKRGVHAIVVAHLYGYPADIHGVQQLAAPAGVVVVEDAAQAAGGTLFGKPLGGIADLSILSFGRGKGMTAGSGGALLFRSRALVGLNASPIVGLSAPRRGGREVIALAAQWVLARPHLYGIPSSIPSLRLGEMVYRPAPEPGAMSEVAATILLAALEMDEPEVARRRARAKRVLSMLGDERRLAPVRSIRGGEPGYLRLAVLDRAGDVLPEQSLGAVRGYPMTLDQHQQLRMLLLPNERGGAGSRFLRDRLFTAPTHSRVREIDTVRIAGWIARREISAPVEAWAT